MDMDAEVSEPFNDPAIEKDSTDHVSSYNQVSAKKSTLHCATLCGILAYMELEEAAAAGRTEAGAIGTLGRHAHCRISQPNRDDPGGRLQQADRQVQRRQVYSAGGRAPAIHAEGR